MFQTKPASAFEKSEFGVTQYGKAKDALHFARKNEQKVWGSGSEHETATAEVTRLEAVLESWPGAPR
jgi:hypothetical protein